VTTVVETFVNGKWHQNCHILAAATGEAIIVDPGSDAPAIRNLIAKRDWRVLAIANTHAHYDHVGAISELMAQYDVPFYLHGADLDLLKRANLYKLLFDSRESIRVPTVTHDFGELPDVVSIGPFEVKILNTPGHTEGSVCLQVDGHLFSGDTLMSGGSGRTDLPGGDAEALAHSLDKIARLPADLLLHGGHGPSVTLSEALNGLAGAAVT